MFNKFASKLLLLLIVIGLIFIYHGCTNEETDDALAINDKDEFVVLKWITALPSVDSDREIVFKEFNSILKEKLNANINFDILDMGQWQTKIPILLSSGEDMDIVWHNWQMSYVTNVNKGLYLPLDDLLKEYGETIIRDIPISLFNNFRINGTIYGIPNYQISTNGNVYVMQKEIIKKTGFDIKSIKTYKDLDVLLGKIKETSPDLPYIIQNPQGKLWEMTRLERGWENVIVQRGTPLSVRWNDNSKTVFNQFKTNEYKEYLEMVYSWYEQGYIRKDVASAVNIAAEEKEGLYSIMIGGTFYYDGYYAKVKSELIGLDYVEVMTGKNYWQYTAGQATMLAIPIQSEKPVKVMEFLNLLNDDNELVNLLAYGIEDKHYKKISEKQIGRIPDSGYDYTWQWSMLNTFKLYTDIKYPKNHNERILKTHESAIPSQLSGFSLNTDEFLTMFSQCISAWNEIGLGLESGVLDPDVHLPRFLQALENAGIDEMIEIVQRQIDEQLK